MILSFWFRGFFKHKADALLCSWKQAKHHKFLLKSCKILRVVTMLKSRTLLLGEGALEGWDDALLHLKFFHVSCPSNRLCRQCYVLTIAKLRPSDTKG